MVQVEERQSISPAPTRASPVVWWLVGVAGAILAVSAVPWERYCSPATDGFPAFCFHAAAWSGSASLYGVLLDALCALFVVLALALGWARRRRLPAGGFILFGACLAALAAKVSIVYGDATHSASVNIEPYPAAGGALLGLALLLVGAICLFVALVERRSLWVTISVVVVAIVVGAVAVPYARSGLAWWGGPLADPRYLGGGNGIEVGAIPGKPAFFDGLLDVQNDGRVAATLDHMTLVGNSPTFAVRGTYVNTGCTAGTIRITNLARCTTPVSGYVVPAGRGSFRWIVVQLVVPRPGLYRAGWTRVEYHVGPLHYEMFLTDQMEACAPELGRKYCPGDVAHPAL